MSYCVLSGNIANWETAVANRIWGVKSTLKKYWDKLQPNDLLFFYCTSPISGIIGYGRLTSKKGDQTIPLWADEVNTGTVIYPFRFEFEIEYVLESRLWQEKKIPIKDLGLSFMSGLNFQRNTTAVESLIKRVKENWNLEVFAIPSKQVQPKIPTNLHDEIKEKIKRIGKL